MVCSLNSTAKECIINRTNLWLCPLSGVLCDCFLKKAQDNLRNFVT